MLILQIKQAECALADGRLDEAYELAGDEQVRRHRRGQELIGRLARAFAQRGRDHLAADRLGEAKADVTKAAELAGQLPEVAALEDAVTRAQVTRHEQQRDEAAKLVAAQRHIADGRLSVGEELLDGIEPTGPAAALQDKAAGRRAVLDNVVADVTGALGRDDFAQAVTALDRLPMAGRDRREITELVGRLRTRARVWLGDAIDQGRVDQAEALLDRLGPWADDSLELQELSRVVGQCRHAWRLFDGGRARDAAGVLRRLQSVRPQADWVADAIAELRESAQAADAVRCGPLGLLNAAKGSARVRPAAEEVNNVARGCVGNGSPEHGLGVERDVREREREFAAEWLGDDSAAEGMAGRAAGAGRLPERFILQVDGVGGFLVIRSRRVTVGAVSSADRPDVGLVADPGLPTAVFERCDEDYFVRSDEPIAVNGKMMTQGLLTDGDKVALSHRCRVKYRRRNAASNTAVLELSGTRLPRADIRQVILMDRELIVGSGGAAHVKTDGADGSFVLFVRDEQLYCRATNAVIANGLAVAASAALPIGTPISVGSLSFVVTTE